ncbi:FG-GAP repeat protein [Lacunisphaera limnophila]|uniref:FG-GAP repeat protein n=1 Tax=Lacunisphaera limnophila TaxID=1838286 RepID=A0A1D8ARV1_9BACT|nr:VCBS repeat-containing protein [Lacunisphaera limnophila]AOS43589.1 FG-GAP repeat protein [Lacunisphaera limnophila]
MLAPLHPLPGRPLGFDAAISPRRWVSLLGAGLLLAAGCARQEPPATTAAPAPVLPGIRDDSTRFTAQSVGGAIGRPPWIAHVLSVDLDQDRRTDLLFCEAQDNEVRWLRQTAPGVFEEKLLAGGLKAPVHVETADMDGDGDLDVLVASMGAVFPNNDLIGTIYILENDGRQNFTPHAVLENTTRAVDVRAADLNGDGRLDLVLGQFGYDQGEIAWLERTGPWEFKRHVLLELSGAINVVVADFNGDSLPDIVAQISQQWEEIHLFENQGGGRFTARRLWGSTNEDYGSSGLTVADMNRDGRPDIVFTNGDGFGPAATPGPRPWHGVQWLENTGGGSYRYHRIASLPGAYGPQVADVDADGEPDIVVTTAYADWNNKNRNVITLMWYRNDGRARFEPHLIARTPKDQITVATGDFDGSGRVSLATGGFYIYPPYDAMSRITVWRQQPKP